MSTTRCSRRAPTCPPARRPRRGNRPGLRTGPSLSRVTPQQASKTWGWRGTATARGHHPRGRSHVADTLIEPVLATGDEGVELVPELLPELGLRRLEQAVQPAPLADAHHGEMHPRVPQGELQGGRGQI